jgi:2-aminophenol/2-amino-5-chlorophenol 1,6-dioxygenase alpha subunit
MPIVSAFLMPGNPLPFLKPDNPAWKPLADAGHAAGKALAASKPDVLLIYSTQWLAVLDELWQARPHSTGNHVDENWYDYGDLEMDLRADVELVSSCIAFANDCGYKSKPVDYADFPIDSGTIVANAFLNPTGQIPAVVAANNLYHDFDTTAAISKIAADQADQQGKRAAVIGIGGLSGRYFDKKIDIAEDRIVRDEDDAANRKLLDAMQQGDAAVRATLPDYLKTAKGDMGMKHLAWLLGGVGSFKGATVHGYGATYGAGAAVVELTLN